MFLPKFRACSRSWEILFPNQRSKQANIFVLELKCSSLCTAKNYFENSCESYSKNFISHLPNVYFCLINMLSMCSTFSNRHHKSLAMFEEPIRKLSFLMSPNPYNFRLFLALQIHTARDLIFSLINHLGSFHIFSTSQLLFIHCEDSGLA